ncbi:MAG: hypothetical protein QOC92_1463 [Acidimicrobiaceae bacterium]
MKAALSLIETFTLRPEELSVDQIRIAKKTGLTDEAIEHAFHVATLFNTIDRVADAFEFHIPEEGFDRGAKMLLRFGYKFPPFLWPRP